MKIWKEENVSYLDEERHIAELHSSRLRQSLQFRSQADQLGQIHFVAVTKVRNLQSRGHRLDHRFLKTCQCTKSIILNKSYLRSKRIMRLIRITEIKPISVFLNVNNMPFTGSVRSLPVNTGLGMTGVGMLGVSGLAAGAEGTAGAGGGGRISWNGAGGKMAPVCRAIKLRMSSLRIRPSLPVPTTSLNLI